MGNREDAVQAYVQALRTGEHSAVAAVAPQLAPDVVLVAGAQEFSGKDAVVSRIKGIWPNTPVYQHGSWTSPQSDGDKLQVSGTFPPFGASPAETHLTFSFNPDGQISRVEQQIVPQAPPTETDTISPVVRGIINGALANATPLTVAYVDENGSPVLSLRGSTQVYSDTQLSIWVRNAEGGLAKALAKNPNMCLLYRDNKTRSTLIIQGRGHFSSDEKVRRRVFEISPEVEQNHDPGMVKGGALIIDVDRIQGGTVYGPVRMVRKAN
jgi:hypothetical protein